MPFLNPSNIGEHHFAWQPQNGEPAVPIEIVHTIQPDSEQPFTVLVHGMGEGRRSASKSLAALGERGVNNVASIVVPYNHPYVINGGHDDAGERLRELGRGAPNTGIQWLLDHYGHFNGVPPRVITRSGGTTAVTLAATDRPDLYGNLALISPVSMGVRYLGSTPAERSQVIFNRMKDNAGQLRKFDTSILTTEIYRNVWKLKKSGVLRSCFQAVVGQDTTAEVVALAEDDKRDVFVFSPAKDGVVHYDEIAYQLMFFPNHRVKLETGMHGAHEPSASMLGLKQLITAYHAIKVGGPSGS